MPLHERLRPFLRLQEIDSERYRLRNAIGAAEKKKEEPRKKLAQARTALAAADVTRLAKERLLADAQLKLKLEEERLQKLEKQMLTLTGGKEYKTMEHQIRGKKADMSLVEDEILHLMEDAEAAKKVAGDARDALQKAEAAAKVIEDAVTAATLEHVARVAVLDQEAAVAEKACDKETLAQYQALLPRRNGVGLAAIANRICQGCYTSITPHEENKLMGGQILTCGNCQRIVYLP
jgi:predicted  nucleic acid-binding Zn-ribbon protein